MSAPTSSLHSLHSLPHAQALVKEAISGLVYGFVGSAPFAGAGIPGRYRRVAPLVVPRFDVSAQPVSAPHELRVKLDKRMRLSAPRIDPVKEGEKMIKTFICQHTTVWRIVCKPEPAPIPVLLCALPAAPAAPAAPPSNGDDEGDEDEGEEGEKKEEEDQYNGIDREVF